MRRRDVEIILDKLYSIGVGELLTYKDALGIVDDVDVCDGYILMFVIKSKNPFIKEGEFCFIGPYGVRYQVEKINCQNYMALIPKMYR